ncbi:MAG TPA: FkbM family methyltransferase [Bacteroidales bacterium]|nr:FkbM family methyltransferase [Bacteroidales bacterium]
MRYDRMTETIMRRVIQHNSNCIDIGCHKGEILDVMLELAPEGKHTAFEPIPVFYNALIEKYKSKAVILPYALSDKNGTADFQYVKNAPAYSGLRKREYTVDPDIEVISVEVKKLDDLIAGQKVNLIKIDVEGAELNVLQGSINTLKAEKPYVIFEFGMGASNYYDSTPEKMFQLLCVEAGLKISTLKSFVTGKGALSAVDFQKLYESQTEYYFIAHP